ncbi:protein phosphatase 1 regulatory subunit 36 [Neopsephotus bourkii]|uniref:protein phosphatase 1 regulatory subunit 36 n=1 Tax=Neopsephotus bourkii TaxID=309878 RepID=UPI002AA5BD1E|nr:protein phosphatase 1 regulatory subunit 36 [Neopsephotus bourkii]
MIPTVRPGMWYWKDDTNTLEFASSSPAVEKNLKEGKNTLFQEICARTLKSIFQDDCSSKLPERKLADKEGKLHMISQWAQHEYVMLDDVRYAALLLKDTRESHHMLSLEVVMGNEKLDDFLMALLFYISFYLEKIALEKKYRSLTLTMISFEKTETDNVSEKLAMSRIHLAKVYCNPILGRRVGLHNFSSYVTWLVFRRKHFQVIREEIGRFLFSDVFNPALRGKKNIELQKRGDGTADANTAQSLYPRKDHDKRLSISSMIQQCSPVLSTLLPLPKDSAQYFFLNQDCQARDPQPRTCDDLPDFSELFTNKVGFIGAHCSDLKPLLSTSEEKKEEEEVEQEETQGRKRRDLSLPSLGSPQNRLSTQSTVL